jgi:hypothetical protein
MPASQANRVVVFLAGVAGVLPLLGTTIFPQYAALLWGLSILLVLVALAIAIPRTTITQHKQLQSWLLILGALLISSLAIWLLSALL